MDFTVLELMQEDKVNVGLGYRTLAEHITMAIS